ncbi:MAG TPA: hypothetical protein VMC09_06830 [Anaerolineales bacterium]|nr:hypothetical protein [Anaerolineales bacterium]
MDKSNLNRRMKSGAGSFYWIAGISIIHTGIFIFFGPVVVFVVGLGITYVLDIVALDFAHLMPNSALLIRGAGVFLDLIVTGTFVAFGYFATRRQRWAFIAGMILYGLDTLLVILDKNYFGLAFHLFFLCFLFDGLMSLNQLRNNESPGKPELFPPKDIHF